MIEMEDIEVELIGGPNDGQVLVVIAETLTPYLTEFLVTNKKMRTYAEYLYQENGIAKYIKTKPIKTSR